MDELDKEFWRAWPRWNFRNCWKGYRGLYGFNSFAFWWTKGGSIGLTVLNFAVEFNPYHEETHVS